MRPEELIEWLRNNIAHEEESAKRLLAMGCPAAYSIALARIEAHTETLKMLGAEP